MIFEGFQTFSGLQNWFLEEEFRDDDSKTDFLGKNLEIIVKKSIFGGRSWRQFLQK